MVMEKRILWLLMSMSRLWIYAARNNEIPRKADPGKDPDYWFRRAQDFAPHDGTLPHLYGIYLYNVGRYDEARDQYVKALAFDENSPDVNYNAGLLYVALEDYDKALDHATRAYDMGYPLPGLRNKLITAGVWQDPQQGQTE